MKDILMVEIRKAVKNPLFYLSIGIGIALSILSAVQIIISYYTSNEGVISTIQNLENTNETSEVFIGAQTLYNSWIGGSWSSLGAILFFFLTPILAALPCGWNFSDEIHTGYLHIIVVREGRNMYFFSKVISSFIAGGLALIIPLLFSFLLVSCFIPAIKPSPLYPQYFGITYKTVCSSLYYSYPLKAVIIVISINFLFGGFYALLSITVSFFSHSRIATLIIPFLFLTTAGMGQSFFSYTTYYSISPLEMLHPFTANNIVTCESICMWLALLFLITVPIIIGKGRKYEIL